MRDLRDLGQQIWRFRPYWQPHLPRLGLGIGLRAGELVADIAKPWPLAIVIDEVLGHRRGHGPIAVLINVLGTDKVQLLTYAAVALLVLTLISGALDYLGDRIMNSAGEAITAAIRRRVFAHLLRLPMSFHDLRAVGELTSRVTTDANRIEGSLIDLFSKLLPGLLSIAGFAGVMLVADWRLGLIGISCAPVVLYTSVRYTFLTKDAARQRRIAEGNMSGMVAETLDGVRTVHALGSHARHEQTFARCNGATLDAGLRAVELRARFTPMLELSTGVGLALLLWLGGYGALRGWWTAGLVVVVLSYLRDMLKPMRALSRMSISLAQGAASAERINEILDIATADPAMPHPLPTRIGGCIQVRDVTFNYGREPVLGRIRLTIQAGERLALLGANGSGKSTLIALIAGLYEPAGGRILVDGIDLAQSPKEWLHRQVALVLQDTFLFSGTIADNIALARPDASRTEIEAAAEMALVTEFTARLPNGLDTELSDHGLGLSGGQRQRVGIARAFLENAPIVLLDEPTTGLDQEAEELVINALSQLVMGRTVLMTAHRPALLRLATRVVRIHRGVLEETDDESRLEKSLPLGAPLAG
jgi:ABC-type multidrug transport system fused ATPase/permease subunit